MREKVLNTIGFSLLALCFVISITRIMVMNWKGKPVGGAEPVTIRFAHWQLENGVRGSFDKIAAEYMKLHPGVKVEQLALPEKIYPNWLVTQLVGETAPDLIELGYGITSERLARFFTPLTDLAGTPNPYNAGTDLEGKPLRDTLFDGMEGGYYANLLEYYGVSISGFCIRMYYNLDLLKAVTGSEKTPKTYEEMIALCKQVQDYSKKKGVSVIPIAGSKYNGPMLMNNFFASQTQTLVERLNPPGIFGNDSIQRANQYLAGVWSLESPEIRSGFTLMREVGQYMQPGFMQLMREDATLLFVQGRALMICTGSWDATSIRDQTSFRIGIFTIPFPSPENPVYGKYTLGGTSEAGANGGVTFGLTRGSKNPEVAKDFLLFLASRKMNQLWTDESGWIPAVLGVKVKPDVTPFLPVTEGYLAGFGPDMAMPNYPFPEVNRLYTNASHILMAPNGGVDAFINEIKGGYAGAIAADLHLQNQANLDIVQRGDTQFAAFAWLSWENPADAKLENRFDAFLQTDSLNRRKFYQIRLALDKANQSVH